MNLDLNIERLQQGIKDDDRELRMIVRAASRRSLFWFNKVVICYGMPQNLMNADAFKPRSEWLQWIVTEHKRGLLEDPRAHMKTWASTISLPPWLAIQVPSEQFDHPNEFKRAQEYLKTHPHLKGSDARYVLVSDSRANAAKWVSGSLGQWNTNQLLRWAFPEKLWPNPNKPAYGKWSQTGYTLNDRNNPRLPDPFLRAAGIESKEQGGRADGIFIDDLVGDANYRSASELEKRREYVKSIAQLLENLNPDSPYGGFLLIIGNRWALDDVNSLVHDSLPRYDVWRRGAFRCAVHDVNNCGRWESESDNPCAPTKIPLWTDMYPDAEALAGVEATIGTEIFDCQWMNDPTRSSELDADNLMPFTVEIREVADPDTGQRQRVWAAIVAKDGIEAEVIPLMSLSHHVVSIDPASSKKSTAAKTGITWIAMDGITKRRFILDVAADRWKPDKAIGAAFDLIEEVKLKIGRYPKVLCERVACQEYVGYALKMHAAAKGKLGFPTVKDIPVPWGVNKEDKLRRRVGNILGQQLLYCRAGLALVRSEIRHFPSGTKDILDTISQAEDVFQQFYGTVDSAKLYKRRKFARDLRRSMRGTTGVPLG